MKQYMYRCKTALGENKAGTLSAESFDAAVTALFAKDWHIVELKSVSVQKTHSVAHRFLNRVSKKTVIHFNRQLARLLHAGLPLVDALEAIRNQMPDMHNTLDEILACVSRGEALHLAFSKHPKIFSPLCVSMVKAGESAGALDKTFERLAQLSEADYANRVQLMQSLMYPCSVATVGLATVFIFSAFVLPRFTMVFEQMGGSLPAITAMLVAFSDFAQQWWWLFLVFCIASFLLLRAFFRHEKGRVLRDQFMLRIPFFFVLVRDIETSQFTRTLGAQIEAGLPMLPALEVAIQTMQNRIYRKAMTTAMERIREGGALSDEMRRTGLFTLSVISLTQTAERGSLLDQTLMEIAEDAAAECARRIRVVLTLMEPVLIVLVGFVVGGLVIAMLLPIFNIEEMLL